MAYPRPAPRRVPAYTEATGTNGNIKNHVMEELQERYH